LPFVAAAAAVMAATEEDAEEGAPTAPVAAATPFPLSGRLVALIVRWKRGP